MSDIKTNTWNLDSIEKSLNSAFDNDSEIELLSILKDNSFLFYELYSRKYEIRPVFKEISFGDTFRCDYAWLNDNSDGPEWVLVEVEKPKMNLFTKKEEPTAALNHALGQLESWERYFEENSNEKSRIFGAVAKFRYILVAGSIEEWQTESAKKWRIHHHKKSNFEIRSTDVFKRPLEILRNKPEELWSFKENPIALKHSDLKTFWENCPYMDSWRRILH